MDASYDTATSPGTNTTTSTVRSAALHVSISPQSVSPPKTSPVKMSPTSPFKPRVPGSPLVKIPGSPTVKISKSAKSSYAGSNTEHARTLTYTSTEKPPLKDVKDSEPVDLTESDDNMETEADVSSSEKESLKEKPLELQKEVVDKEIFHEYEEISPNEIMEEINPDEIVEGEIEEMDVVTSSTGREYQVSEAGEEPEEETVDLKQEKVYVLPYLFCYKTRFSSL